MISHEIASPARAQEQRLFGRWLLDADHIEGQRLRAEAGDIAGQIIGAPQLSPEPAALTFDGRQDRIQISDNIAAAKLPAASLTVEAWVAVDRAQEWGGIASAIQDNGAFERGWLLGFRQSRFCFGVASEGKRRLTYLTAEEDFALGAWYHVTGVYDGAQMQLFVDGKLVASSKEQSGRIVYPPTGVFTIGAYHDDNELYPLQGAIAEVSVFGGALPEDAVANRFAEGESRFPVVEPVAGQVVGWPTYMRDNRRSGLSPEELQFPLALAWSYKAPHPPQPAWPPPANQDFWHNKQGLKARVTYDRAFHVVSDGDSVLFGSSADDKVYCLDLASGAEKWSFFAEGPVRLAPTLWEGKVYFGADDGYVYCLAAHDGALLWKHRAAPSDRRAPGNGRIISVWPVRTGVMIENGQARFAAGLFPNQGVYQFALDAQSGKVLAQGAVSFSPQGYMARSGGSLMIAQGRAADALLARLKRAGKTITPELGKLPAEYPYALIGAGNVRIAGGDGKAAAFNNAGEQVWQTTFDGKAYSLAITGGRLLISTDRGVVHCFAPSASVAAAAATESLPASPNSASNSPFFNREIEQRTAAVSQAALKAAQVNKGYCLLLNAGDGVLPATIAKQSDMQVVALASDDQSANSSRRALDNAGLYGRVVVHRAPLDEPPYGEGLFNLIVLDAASTAAPSVSAKKLFKLLRPGGGAAVIALPLGQRLKAPYRQSLIKWSDPLPESVRTFVEEDGVSLLVLRRGPLAGAGQWTHLYGDAGNTACSGDERVAAKMQLQWFGRPGPQQMVDRHHRTVSPLYTAGRMFIPGDNRVIALDAYNGAILWNVEIANSRRVAAMRDCGNMAATEDYLYIAAQNHCHGLDAQTGQRKLNFDVPLGNDGQPRHWGYMANVGQQLFGSATRPGASRSGHSRQQIYETYWDFVPLVTSDAVFSLDRHSGALQWRYEAKRGAIINPTLTLGGGRMYFIESTNAATLDEPTGRSKLQDLLAGGAELVALDADSGRLLWRERFDFSVIQHHLFLCYSDERLVAVGTKNKKSGPRSTVWYDLHGFSAADGKHTWSATQNQGQGVNGDHGEQDHHPVIVGGRVYAEPYAYDLKTGQRIDDWKLARGGHGCGTMSASASAFFFRATNPVMCDLSTGAKTRITQVSRPGCWINIIPAGGMILIPEASSGCSCNFAIQSSMAFMAVQE